MAPRLRRRRRLQMVVASSIAFCLLGCESDPPALDPGIGTEAPAQTSNTLGACPPGGPDATTPTAGCLGPDGSVQRP